jgi:ribulose-phosphate 3-epimerase
VSWRERMREVEVEPSIYAADFARLGEQIDELLAGGARVFHYDVGDGHFVEPIIIGPIVLESIGGRIRDGGGVVDCHLMVESPERHFEQIRDAGGDSVTVHYEACPDLAGVVGRARELELQVGLALNPETEPLQAAGAAVAAGVDLILCMSIHPGYSGQRFMPEAIERVRTLRARVPEGMYVQVDGGIGLENVRLLREAGADLFVAGTSIFGREDLARAYEELLRAVT